MQALIDLGFHPVLCGTLPRVQPDGLESAEQWLINLDKRVAVPDDPAQQTVEIGNRETANEEILGFRKYFNGDNNGPQS